MRLNLKIYIIKYIVGYQYYDGNCPIEDILNYYFLDYSTAYNFAKYKKLENFDILELKLGAIKNDNL